MRVMRSRGSVVVTGLGGTGSATLSTACQDVSLRAGRVRVTGAAWGKGASVRGCSGVCMAVGVA